MDWYVCLTPLLLIPIVWLFYFVGCSLLLPNESNLVSALLVEQDAWGMEGVYPLPENERLVNVRVAFFAERAAERYSVICEFQVRTPAGDARDEVARDEVARDEVWYRVRASGDFAEDYTVGADPPRRRYRFRAGVLQGRLLAVIFHVRRGDETDYLAADADVDRDLHDHGQWFGAWQDSAPDATRGDFTVDAILRSDDPDGG